MRSKVQIGSHSYAIDLAQTVRRPIASLRQTVDGGAEAGEGTLDNSALWKRTQSDFILGQGQSFFDQEEESNRRRCRSVYGFDPVADRRALSVALSCSSAVSAYAGGTAGAPRLLRTRSNWWIVPTGSGVIKRSASLVSFSMTDVTGTTAAKDATVFGDTVYVCDGASVFSGSITGSSVSSFSTVDTDVIDATLGRLVCGHDGELFELDNAGAKIEIYTHANPQWAWIDFAVGNAGIYCAGNDGLRSEIYLMTVIESDGAFIPPSPVAALPAGELIRTIEYFGGFLVIGTNRGVRVAQASQSGLLNYGPLISLGDVYGISFDGRFAYATCSSFPTFGGPGAVVLSMDRFTAPLTPAYAAAYPVTASGHTAYDVGTNAGQVVVLTGNGTNVQLHSTASASGIGIFWSGQITFGTPEPKQFQVLEVVFDPLVSGGSVTAEVYDKQGGTLIATGFTSSVGATSLTVTGEAKKEAFEVYLIAGGATTIRRWTLRAVPAPTYVAEEIILALILKEEVGDDDGQALGYDVLEEWNYLTELAREREKVQLTFGARTDNVWVDQVGAEQGSWASWDQRSRWPEGTVLVRLVTVGL